MATRLQVITRGDWLPDTLRDRIGRWSPKTDLGRIVRECFAFLPPEQAGDLLAAIQSSLVIETAVSTTTWRHPDNRVPARLLDSRRGRARDALYVLLAQRDRLLRARDVEAADLLLPQLARLSWQAGLAEPFGIVGGRVVTTAGVNWLVDSWQNTYEPETMKYHGVGTGSTAEAAGDTALVTESTTALNPDSTRATGSLTEGASANIFRSVGTLTADGSITVAEHGLFNQAATGGGTLWDRTVLSPTSGLSSGDSLTVTYDMTASSGG